MGREKKKQALGRDVEHIPVERTPEMYFDDEDADAVLMAQSSITAALWRLLPLGLNMKPGVWGGAMIS